LIIDTALELARSHPEQRGAVASDWTVGLAWVFR